MARTAHNPAKTKSKKEESKKTEKKKEIQRLSPPASIKLSRKLSSAIKTPKIIQPMVSSQAPKFKRNHLVIKEIRHYQTTYDTLMRKLPFSRLVRNTLLNITKNRQNFRFTKTSLMALQEAFEAFLVSMFEDSYLCTIHAKRSTLYPKDIELYKKICKKFN